MTENTVSRENFIVIQGWMLTDLKLKGNEIIVYACIYGFSQAEGHAFSGSLRYLADWTNSTKQGVMKSLKSLIEKGHIIKTVNVVNGVRFCEYRATKSMGGMQQNTVGGMQQSCPNNIDIYNLEDNIGVTTETTPPNVGVVSSVTQTREENGSNSSSDDERPDFDTVEVYASGNLEWLSPRNMEELADFKTEFPDEVIRHAIDEACANGVRRWSYVRGILLSWQKYGVRTLGDAKAAQERYRAEKQRHEERRRNDRSERPRAEVGRCLM